MDDLAGIPVNFLGIGSGWLIVALYTLAVMRGQLVPRRTYEDALHDRDTWRAAHMVSEAARVKTEANGELFGETARTMSHFMSEMQDRLGPGRGPRSGGSRHEQEEPL